MREKIEELVFLAKVLGYTVEKVAEDSRYDEIYEGMPKKTFFYSFINGDKEFTLMIEDENLVYDSIDDFYTTNMMSNDKILLQLQEDL